MTRLDNSRFWKPLVDYFCGSFLVFLAAVLVIVGCIAVSIGFFANTTCTVFADMSVDGALSCDGDATVNGTPYDISAYVPNFNRTIHEHGSGSIVQVTGVWGWVWILSGAMLVVVGHVSGEVGGFLSRREIRCRHQNDNVGLLRQMRHMSERDALQTDRWLYFLTSLLRMAGIFLLGISVFTLVFYTAIFSGGQTHLLSKTLNLQESVHITDQDVDIDVPGQDVKFQVTVTSDDAVVGDTFLVCDPSIPYWWVAWTSMVVFGIILYGAGVVTRHFLLWYRRGQQRV